MRILRGWWMILLAAFGVVLMVDALFCQFTLHVAKSSVKGTPAGYRDISVTARDGATLRAWFALAKENHGRCVLVLHGIGDSRLGSAGFAPLFLGEGYSVLLPDSRAHGESGGEVVTYGLLEKYDALTWAKWGRANGCEKLYGLGESLGGAVLIQAVAIGSDFRAIVAECAYSDLRSIASERVRQVTGLPEFVGRPLIVDTAMIYARWRYGLDLSQVSPRTSIGTAATSVLLIHG